MAGPLIPASGSFLVASLRDSFDLLALKRKTPYDHTGAPKRPALILPRPRALDEAHARHPTPRRRRRADHGVRNLLHASLATTLMYLNSDDVRRAKLVVGRFAVPRL